MFNEPWPCQENTLRDVKELPKPLAAEDERPSLETFIGACHI